MNDALNITNLLANMDTDLARGIAALLAVGALLLVLAKIRSMISKAAYRSQRRGPQLSRAAAKQLTKEGIRTNIRRQNQTYRGTAHRRYEYR